MRPDERELIVRAQEGNMEAFEKLVCRYDRQVLSISLKFTRDPEEAKDIYQEVFMKIFRSLGSFAFKSEFSTWLYRVATNVSLSHVSSENRRRQSSIDAEDERSGIKGQRIHKTLVSKPESERRAFSQEIAVRVNRAIDTLSTQQRAVFVLRHYEGHKLREIAEILKCAEGTVKNHLFTATMRMREQLKELHA